MKRLCTLVPSEIGTVQFDFLKSLWLWGMIFFGVFVGVPNLNLLSLVLSLVLAFLTLCVGHSVGLHRGIIHRTYKTHPIFRGILVYLFVLSGLGGPLSWARLHAVRDFWQSRKDCPKYFAYDHPLWMDFFWNLHCRFVPKDSRADVLLGNNLFNNRWLLFLEKTWPLHIGIFAGCIAAFFGLKTVATVICARTAAGILGHWFIGYAAHAWGERRFKIKGAKESGTNVFILGLISFGEGFHNNHHAFPHSAQMGIGRHEFDLGWQVIRFFKRCHLVWDVQGLETGSKELEQNIIPPIKHCADYEDLTLCRNGCGICIRCQPIL